MTFKGDFPELYQFFVGYFPDADDLSDEEVVLQYKTDCLNSEDGVGHLVQTKAELDKIMNEIYDLNLFNEVVSESNRYFESQKDIIVWLKMIRSELEI